MLLEKIAQMEIMLDGVINLGKAVELSLNQDFGGVCTLTLTVPVVPAEIMREYGEFFKMREVVEGKGDASP